MFLVVIDRGKYGLSIVSFFGGWAAWRTACHALKCGFRVYVSKTESYGTLAFG